MIAPHAAKFFQIQADHVGYPDQWFLNEPRDSREGEIDPRDFTRGSFYRGAMPVELSIGNSGRELAFNLGAFDMPVVSNEVADIIRRTAPDDVECFPVHIPKAIGTYQILNVTHALDCLDESRSEVTLWQPGDSQPDRVGSIKMVWTLRVDPNRTEKHHIFRLAKWRIALLVSNTFKEALSGIPNLGVLFEPAS